MSFFKNDCWYRTDPMDGIGPFPMSWFYGSQGHTEILPWFPLPSNLINKGEEWIPEVQLNATVCLTYTSNTSPFWIRLKTERK